MPRSRIGVLRTLFVAVVALAAISARAQDAVPIITPTMPNYVGVGLGVTPDYIGADDYFFGGLPLARYQFENSSRYASLVGITGVVSRFVESFEGYPARQASFSPSAAGIVEKMMAPAARGGACAPGGQ